MNNNKNSSRITTIIIFVLIGIIILVGLIAFNVTGNLFGDNNSIALSEKNIEMRKGESLQFETTTKNREELIYTSSNPNIVSVNEITGLVIANGYGTATITVSLKSNNKIKDECIVTVVKPQNGVEVSSISLTPSSITLQVGSTKQLTYKIMPTDASNKKTYWSTSNSEVATIDKNGIVTTKSVGTAKIKIRTENGAFATCDVTVSKSSTQNPTPTTTYTLTYNANGGSVSPGSKTLNKGAQYGSLPTPTRSGYTFNGWYTASSGGSKVSSNTTINGNTTIYAQWTKNSTPTQLPNMTCTGTITRAGTKITVSPSSNDVKEYKWVINGKTINGTNTYSEYKIIDKFNHDKAVSFKDKALFELIEKFVLEAGFKGQIDIDIFEIGGQYYISEVNPRFGGGYPHAYELGCDHMKLILNNLKGKENKKKIGAYEEGVYMLKYTEVKMLRG